jgi:hypothetical protein
MATEISKKVQRKQFAFTGEWVSEVDPLLIGDENFSKLENCRYSDVGVEGVLGYTKITNAVIQTTFYKGRSGIQLLSPYSGQNRVLVHAENAGLTSSSVFENVGVVPAASNFTGAPIHTDTATAGLGRFSKWPGGHIAYCNQKESRIWAGDEMRCAGFVNYAPSSDFKYNYTEAIQNLEDDAYNVATIHRVTESVDANTMALYHMADVNDATANAHNLTNNNVTFIAAGAKFGTTGASFNGTNAELHVALPDAHFAQSGRTFTVDAWVKLTSLPAGGASVSPIYFQSSDASIFEGLWVNHLGQLEFSSRQTAASVEQFAGASPFATPAGTIVVNTWHHVEMVQSANNFYMFVDGILKAYTTGTTTLGDQTGGLYIGFCNTLAHANNYLFGYIDEWRFSNVARHTGAFEVPSAAYGSNTYASYMYVGALRPLSGIKFYVKTPNASAGDLTIDYWDGSSWAAVSGLTNGTASTGATPFEQTGTAAFTSTISTAKVKIIDTLCLFWYRVKVTECDASTTIYHVSVKSPWQAVKDLWDGVYRTAVKFMTYDDGKYIDFTTNVAEEDYDATNVATYAGIGTLTYNTDYMLVGFEEPVTAIRFNLASGQVNTHVSDVIAVKYWNGDDWASVGTVDDGTIDNNTTFGKSGIISWNPITFNSEFKTTVGGSDVPLYYYKIHTLASTMAATIYIDMISGITTPRNMDYGYVFPFMFASRPMLCGKVSSKEGNRVDYGGANTTEIWNGEDTSFGYAGPLYFGSSTDLTCACEIYNRFGAAIYDLAVFCKQNETYILNGTDSESWKIYQISSEIGCPAPMTMDTAEVAFGIAADATRNIALWLSASGPMVFDGSVLVPVKTRIGNYFDDEETECINWDAVANAVGWCDPNYHEYNLCIPSGAGQTTNNVWLVLDLLKKRWFRKVPGTAGCPQGVVKVQDTYGTKYVYGLFDDGYMRRLEYGTTWDGDRINQVIQTSDILPSGSSWDFTEITKIRMMFEKISALTGVSVFYGQNGTSTLEKLMEFDPTQSDMRTYREVNKVGRKCQAWSHAFEFQAGTTAVEKGLKFLGWSYEFEVLREDDGQTLVKGNWK